jgi:predicted site-specific integrase-resolvase
MQKSQPVEVSEYLSRAEVLRFLHISPRTLERYVATAKLPVAYLPSGHRRYARSDVEALLTRDRVA